MIEAEVGAAELQVFRADAHIFVVVKEPGPGPIETEVGAAKL